MKCILISLLGRAKDVAAGVVAAARSFFIFYEFLARYLPRQAGAAALEVYNFYGAPRAPSLDSQGENARSGLHWLYLTMTLLKALFLR